MLGGQLSLQRSDLASGIQTHLRGEARRLYKLAGKGTMSFALCLPIWSISVRNRAENMWILLTDWSKSFASSSSRNWFSIFSPSKWTSHWFFCLILFFGFGNHWLFFFFWHLKNFFYLFLVALGFHCCAGFSLVAASRDYSWLRCAGVSLWWPVLLQSTGSRRADFSSCSSQPQELWCEQALVAPWHVESSQTRDRTRVPTLTGGFLSTVPPGRSRNHSLLSYSQTCFFSFPVPCAV